MPMSKQMERIITLPSTITDNTIGNNMNHSFVYEYATDRFRPIITDVQETSLSVKWYKPDLVLTVVVSAIFM